MVVHVPLYNLNCGHGMASKSTNDSGTLRDHVESEGTVTSVGDTICHR